MSGTRPVVTVGVASDVGRVRVTNEDCARAEGLVFVVADGMGGHAAGEVASQIAVETVVELASRPELALGDVVEQLGVANRRILDSAQRHPERTGMGTTLAGVAAVTVDGEQQWAVFNIGDSRVYHWAEGELTQVTVDHSEVWELVVRGLLTPEQAQRHPGRNIVTRSLGREPMGVVDTWVIRPRGGEAFVVCSDGLSNELTNEQIGAVLGAHPDAHEAAAELVRQAVAAGGRDNVTALVLVTES